MRIPATKPELPPRDLFIDEISNIWKTGILTNQGEKVHRLQSKLKSRIGCDNIELFVNGHTALFLCIKSMGFPEKGEVLTSPFTFASTTNAILQNNLTPVFCDINGSYNISVSDVRKKISKKTCAIVAPHIFGIPCDVEEIANIAKEYGLKVIYDGAQAFGTKIKGKDIGCFGDATMFSFHAIKVYNSIEGGALTFLDNSLEEKLHLYRNFGIPNEDKQQIILPGYNGKMDELRAAMGLVNLLRVDDVIEKRKRIAQQYITELKDINGINTYDYSSDVDYNYAYFPILIDENKYGKSRDELQNYLSQFGVGSRALYSRLTCDTICYQNIYEYELPIARMISKSCLDLPLYSSLSKKDVSYITDLIASCK